MAGVGGVDQESEAIGTWVIFYLFAMYWYPVTPEFRHPAS
jgi:hypothetical protein